jgi:hypothetical protein
MKIELTDAQKIALANYFAEKDKIIIGFKKHYKLEHFSIQQLKQDKFEKKFEYFKKILDETNDY